MVLNRNNSIIDILDQFDRIESVKLYPRDSFLYLVGYNVMGHDVSLLYEKINIGLFKDSFKFYAFFQPNILPSSTKLMQWSNEYIAKYKNPYLIGIDSFTFCDSFYLFNGTKIYSDTTILPINYNPEYPYCSSIKSIIKIKKYNSPKTLKKSLGLNCDKSSIVLSNTNPYSSRYLWNTNDTTSYINVRNVGQYILTYYHPCGVFKDSFTIVDSSKKTFDSTNVYSCTPYLWQGVVYSKSTILKNIYKSVHNCDSIITINLYASPQSYH